MVDIQGPLTNALNMIITYIPAVIGAIIILIIGWIIGRVAGGVVSKLLQKTGADDAIAKTGVGETLKGTGMSITGLVSTLVKWFFYLIFILAAVSVLNIPVFTNFVNEVVLYIPNLIAGALVLIVGLLAINFLMNWFEGMMEAENIAFASIISMALKALFSIVVIVIALDQLKISTGIIYTFLVPLAWGFGIGLAIAMGIAFGVGGKDVVADYLRKAAKMGESKAGDVQKKAEEMEGRGGEKVGKEEEFREPGEGVPRR
ncbi:mechanosensitive ion channel family protein [Methanobacterium sp.]|uniref:mechanosensitive ion channel family protein n=1 Tax=Methanobacterium sp. TaxID=2164 RepID=UPI003C716456